MPLIDDGIKYNTDDKSDGNELVDGETDTVIGFQPTKGGRKGKNTPLPNYSTVTDWC